MKVVIVHGTNANPEKNWYPWLKKQLESCGHEVFVPALPDSAFPNGEKWIDYILENTPFAFDEDTVVVGHSAGAAVIPELLQKLPDGVKVKKAILVSGFYTDLGWEKLQDLHNVKVDYDDVKQKAEEFILVHSDNDPYVKLSEAEWLAEKLGGQLRVLEGQGHFNMAASPQYKEFPKLFYMIVKGDYLQRLYLMSSFRGAGVADLVMSDAEKKIGKAPQDVKVLYITTAGNLHPVDKRTWIVEGREILMKRGWQVIDYDLDGKMADEVKQAVEGKDVVFVQGGNQFYLLKKMQESGFYDIIKKFLAKGGLYFGESAGAIVCSENIAEQLPMSECADFAELEDYSGLGLINCLIRPHWNRQGEKRERFFRPVVENAEEFYSIEQPIICLNDNQLVYVEGDDFQVWKG